VVNTLSYYKEGNMKKNTIQIALILAFCLLSQLLYSQQSIYSITTDPSKPTEADRIVITLINQSHNCCVNYDSQTVVLDGSKIYLFYSASNVNNACMCPSPGMTTFDTDPLSPGTYEVYVVEAGKHCPPGLVCIDIMPSPEKAGEITLTGKPTYGTYMIDRNQITCFVDPCRYFKVYAADVKEPDTLTVSGVKDTAGDYVCVFCRVFIPWIDGDIAVKGYFDTDSLTGWVYRDTVFVVTEIMYNVHGINYAGKNTGLEDPVAVYPNPFSKSVFFEIRTANSELRDIQLTIYDIYGKLVQQLDNRGSHSVERFSSYAWEALNKPAGIYILKLRAGNRIWTRKLVLRE
jgi:hypothetical protein